MILSRSDINPALSAAVFFLSKSQPLTPRKSTITWGRRDILSWRWDLLGLGSAGFHSLGGTRACGAGHRVSPAGGECRPSGGQEAAGPVGARPHGPAFLCHQRRLFCNSPSPRADSSQEWDTARVSWGHQCAAPGPTSRVKGRRSRRAKPRGPAGGRQWSSLKRACGPWLGSGEVSRARLDLVQTNQPFLPRVPREAQS